MALWRTIVSHGVAALPPSRIDEERRVLHTTLTVPNGRPRRVSIENGRPGHARVEVFGPAPSAGARQAISDSVRRVLNLDENLSAFYELVASGFLDAADVRSAGGKEEGRRRHDQAAVRALRALRRARLLALLDA
ncbi:MAG: hypothetical protein H0U03_04980 [Actinobacteria bacterium]|nr:hypothetical protein [Actinomycetota bacterium]